MSKRNHSIGDGIGYPVDAPLEASMSSLALNPPATPTPVEDIAAALERVTPLHGTTFEERMWIAQNGHEVAGQPGETLFDENTPAEWMMLILKGEVQVQRQRGGPVFMGRAAQMTGLLPFSRMKTFGGQGKVITPYWGVMVHKSKFPEMLHAIPSMAQRVVSTLLDRVREVTRIEQQAEKLTALGKLAGNLAHELNNPASAAQRAASSLVTELRANRENRFKLVNLCLSEEQIYRIEEWEQRVMSRPEESLNATDAITREEGLRKWLADLPCDNAWDVAPDLAEQSVSVPDLDDLHEILDANTTCVALQFFARYLRSSRSVNTLLASSARIFDLISAIKDYSNMDRAAIQEVDVPAGLDATVQMMQSHMNRVRVVREYQPNLPCISAYSGELNQVWTALLENALEAMQGLEGELRLICKLEGEFILVEIWDNGTGIPPELQDRIFEPFFTTKAPGQGLGLGLDTAMRIVRKHRGFLGVRSESGSTCFKVRLPLSQFEAY
jgi:signal transduction histidine kinase